jgi:CBS-domain-containing membrane protein
VPKTICEKNNLRKRLASYQGIASAMPKRRILNAPLGAAALLFSLAATPESPAGQRSKLGKILQAIPSPGRI